jgi:hypothetical protein
MEKDGKGKNNTEGRKSDTEAAREFTADGMLTPSSKRHSRRFYKNTPKSERKNDENKRDGEQI